MDDRKMILPTMFDRKKKKPTTSLNEKKETQLIMKEEEENNSSQWLMRETVGYFFYNKNKNTYTNKLKGNERRIAQRGSFPK